MAATSAGKITQSLRATRFVSAPPSGNVSFVVSAILVGVIQPQLVGLIIYSKVGLMMLKTKAGIKLGRPKLAPFVWPIYLTAEEGGRQNVFRREVTKSYSQATASVPRRIVFSILALWTFADACRTALFFHQDDAPWWLCLLGFFLSALAGLCFIGVIVMVWDWIARWFAHRRSAARE